MPIASGNSRLSRRKYPIPAPWIDTLIPKTSGWSIVCRLPPKGAQNETELSVREATKRAGEEEKEGGKRAKESSDQRDATRSGSCRPAGKGVMLNRTGQPGLAIPVRRFEHRPGGGHRHALLDVPEISYARREMPCLHQETENAFSRQGVAYKARFCVAWRRRNVDRSQSGMSHKSMKHNGYSIWHGLCCRRVGLSR